MQKFIMKNNIEKVLRGDNTVFLNPIEANNIEKQLRKMNCEVHLFKLFAESEKIILYQKEFHLTLFEIKSATLLTHQQILGSLFSHQLKEEMFGDIVIGDHYYIVVLDQIKEYMLRQFRKVGNVRIELIERPLNIVSNFQLSYQDIFLNVTSLRIDTVIARIIPTSRSISKGMIEDEKVFVNYRVLKNTNYILKENDIFSVRGIGKFKFIEVSYVSKNNKYHIFIKKYK